MNMNALYWKQSIKSGGLKKVRDGIYEGPEHEYLVGFDAGPADQK